jgi:hypothetical protein
MNLNPAEAMQKQQQIMMQMTSLQNEFMAFQTQAQANPGSIPPAQAASQMQAFQSKLNELSESLKQIAAAQRKNQEQAMPPAAILHRPSVGAMPAAGTGGPNPNGTTAGGLPPPRIAVPNNLSGPLPILTTSGGAGGAPAKVTMITPPPSSSPPSSSGITVSPAKVPTPAAPKVTNGMLKAGPLLKLGGKKAFGHKWQLRKCCVLVSGDMEWYDADPNDPSHAVYKGKMTLKGAAYKDIDNGHPDFARLRKTGHKNIPKDNPDFMGFFSLYSSNKNKTYFFAVPMKYREAWKKAIADVSK